MNTTMRHTTLAGAAGYRWWIRSTARPHGAAIVALDLFYSDRIDCPVVIVTNSVLSARVGWALIKGYLNVFVSPTYRCQGIGASIVEECARVYGNDLMFSTKDPSASRMFRKFLTRGLGV